MLTLTGPILAIDGYIVDIMLMTYEKWFQAGRGSERRNIRDAEASFKIKF